MLLYNALPGMKICVNGRSMRLIMAAFQGKLDPVIGRQHQLERVIVEGLVQAIANATVPPKLQDKKVTNIIDYCEYCSIRKVV